ncbi:MAG: hypothetical protein V3S97_05165 [Candidatus Bathyarchaeia archaeon]
MKVPKRIDVKEEEMKALLERVESRELNPTSPFCIAIPYRTRN